MAAVPNKQYGGNILEAFIPKAKNKTDSTTSTTTGTNVSADGINELIRQMMESDSGLANLLTGQQSRGLYNSTTAKLLADDLVARVAGKAAVASAPTTVTEKKTSSTTDASGKANPKYAAGLEILGQLLNTGAGKEATSNVFGALGSGIKNLLGLGDGNPKDSKQSPVIYDQLAPNNASQDYFSSSVFGPKNKFGKEEDKFSTDFMNLGGTGLSSGLGLDGLDFSPFTLGDFSLLPSSGGSSYKSALSYSPISFGNIGGGGSSGFNFGGGSNGNSGISFGFSF